MYGLVVTLGDQKEAPTSIGAHVGLPSPESRTSITTAFTNHTTRLLLGRPFSPERRHWLTRVGTWSERTILRLLVCVARPRFSRTARAYAAGPRRIPPPWPIVPTPV